MTEPVTLTPEAQGLADAGFPGAMVCQSPPHPLLMELAAKHAMHMARVRLQSHRGFGARFAQLRKEGLGDAAEICAQSWARQADDTMQQLGYEMFKCWKQSPGHWTVASRTHKYWGGGIARGRNGIVYACILVVD